MNHHVPSRSWGKVVVWAGVLLLICVFTAIVTTWPVGANLSTTLPLGTEHEATVPLFNLWTLWWTADRAMHGFSGYWDAPIFYPGRGVFTYSEPQPLTGLLVAPLWGLGAPPALIYNVALLGLLILNGVFAYRVARALDLPRLPAVLCAVLTIALPFVAKVSGALQLTALFGMLWTLDGLLRFGQTGILRWAVWAAAGFVATYLTCEQYTLIFAPFAAAAGGVALADQQYQRRPVLRLVGAGLVAGLLVFLVALPALQFHSEQGFERPDAVVQALSAQPGDFLTRPGTASINVPPPDANDTAGLFPGALLTLLALAGGILGIREPARRRWTLYLLACVVLGALLALGMNIDLGGWQPYRAVRAVMPGFGELRSPFRFAVIFQLCLPILAAHGLARLMQRATGRYAGLIVILGLLAAAENLLVPVPLTAIPLSPRTAWTTWLRAQPTSTVIAHVPFPAGLHVSNYEIETWRMYAQIDHHKPMVNGYSGFFPQARGSLGEIIPAYTLFQLSMAQQFPNEPLFCILTQSLGVTTLVVQNEWLDTHTSEMDSYQAFFQPTYADDAVHIYALHMPAGQCQSQ